MAKPLRAVIAILVVILVAALIWLLFFKKDDNSSTSSAPSVHKTVMKYSAAELPAAVSAAESPVYWLGPKSGNEYELTLISDGRAYIRYLPPSVPAEAEEPYLTVGSYSFQDPTAELKKLGQNPGSHTFTVPGGGLGMATESASQHVYVAFPEANVEIEVFDPHTGSAEQAAKSGELTPIH